MSFEEDLEYANTFLKIRTLMENMDEVFKIRTIGSVDLGCYEYCINDSRLCIGHLNKSPSETPIMSCLEHSLVYDRRNDWFGIANTDVLEVKYYTIPDSINEEWYFQQSLLHTPEVMTRLVLFNVLKSTPSEFSYFHIDMYTFNHFIQG